MKNLTNLLALLITVGLVSFGCQPESVAPKSQTDSGISADGPTTHPRPAPQCSRSSFFDLKDGAGNTTDLVYFEGIDPVEYYAQIDYGQIEVVNDESSFWFILQFGELWYTAQERIFVGPLANVPINNITNTIATDQFASQLPVSPSRNFFQVMIPFDGGARCKAFVVWSQIHLLDDLSLPVNFKEVWGAGNSFLNGYVMNGYCFNPCPVVTKAQTCANNLNSLSALITEGVPPFSITWWKNNEYLGSGADYNFTATAPTTIWVRVVDSMNNGDTLAFECGPCSVVTIDNPTINAECAAILTGLPNSVNGGRTCATLSASSTAGGPLTWIWSNGATTATTTVCAAGTYCVTVTNLAGASASSCVTVNAINVRCYAGNSPHHKVTVCHKPPGNPANVQNICIDWSGVPAHVAAYRAPGSNPNMGHDSGCQIGPCGQNTCQQ